MLGSYLADDQKFEHLIKATDMLKNFVSFPQRLGAVGQVLKLFAFNLAISFSIVSVASAADENEVALLDELQLVQEAKLGNVHAQYRLAKLVYVGGITNWRNYDYIDLINKAALQGHEFATYDLYRYKDRRCPFSIDTENNYSECIEDVKLLLTNLAANDKAHANYLLSWILEREALQSDSDIKKRMAHNYVVRGAELGSRSAMEMLAARVFKEKPKKALQLLEEALGSDADYSDDAERYSMQTCNILYDLHQIYAGEKSLFFGNETKKYTDAMDETRKISVLLEGRKRSCHLLMVKLAEHYLESSSPDYLDVYILLTNALSISESKYSYSGFNDNIHLMLAETAIRLDDANTAKMHFASVESDDWQEIIFDEYGAAQFFCKSQGVARENCQSFIKN